MGKCKLFYPYILETTPITISDQDEHGVDYSDDDYMMMKNQRKTFYQSHIFPMHMLQSLKVLLSCPSVIVILSFLTT